MASGLLFSHGEIVGNKSSPPIFGGVHQLTSYGCSYKTYQAQHVPDNTLFESGSKRKRFQF